MNEVGIIKIQSRVFMCTGNCVKSLQITFKNRNGGRDHGSPLTSPRVRRTSRWPRAYKEMANGCPVPALPMEFWKAVRSTDEADDWSCPESSDGCHEGSCDGASASTILDIKKVQSINAHKVVTDCSCPGC